MCDESDDDEDDDDNGGDCHSFAIVRSESVLQASSVHRNTRLFCWGDVGNILGFLGAVLRLSWRALGGSLGAFSGALGGPFWTILEGMHQKKGESF